MGGGREGWGRERRLRGMSKLCDWLSPGGAKQGADKDGRGVQREQARSSRASRTHAWERTQNNTTGRHSRALPRTEHDCTLSMTSGTIASQRERHCI